MLKVWSPKEHCHVAAVDTGANVCSVRFNPWREHLIAAGSAAHTALVFDLRMMRVGGTGAGTCGAAAPTTVPLASFGGHRKAVAYVRWAGEDEVLSASTDSMLRLWSLRGAPHKGGADAATADAATHLPAASAAETGKHTHMGRMGSSGAWADEHWGEAVRTYSGHTNERNFVGLSQAGNYIATGSETGEVFIYLKHINTPSIRHRLTSSYPPANAQHAFHLHHRHHAQQQSPPFISAVSWRQRSQTLMAANSQGHLWALALQP
ncbi:WD40-repeat-containing domain protein [Dunaliella salina]|nr:WD40-repeat-containing domain protein [Dunaliella salina]|eukprot:KAF5837968.1 WD40-repeat-containing domain protein [Dunaliella salina]